MENLLDSLKDKFQEVISFKCDDDNHILHIIFKDKKMTKNELGEKNEIIDMIKIIGGNTEDIQMEIEVDENSQEIIIKFQNKNDMYQVIDVFQNLWEKAVGLLKKAILGDFTVIKNLSDFND